MVDTFDDPNRELDFCGVYRLSKNGKLTLLTDEMTAPNGIGFSPDEKTLYVAQSDPKAPIWKAFDVNEDGTISNGPRLLRRDGIGERRKEPGAARRSEGRREGQPLRHWTGRRAGLLAGRKAPWHACAPSKERRTAAGAATARRSTSPPICTCAAFKPRLAGWGSRTDCLNVADFVRNPSDVTSGSRLRCMPRAQANCLAQRRSWSEARDIGGLRPRAANLAAILLWGLSRQTSSWRGCDGPNTSGLFISETV